MPKLKTGAYKVNAEKLTAGFDHVSYYIIEYTLASWCAVCKILLLNSERDYNSALKNFQLLLNRCLLQRISTSTPAGKSKVL
jgi:hypothetical protein